MRDRRQALAASTSQIPAANRPLRPSASTIIAATEQPLTAPVSPCHGPPMMWTFEPTASLDGRSSDAAPQAR